MEEVRNTPEYQSRLVELKASHKARMYTARQVITFGAECILWAGVLATVALWGLVLLMIDRMQ